jgi:lysophospholipase L1-like esterase
MWWFINNSWDAEQRVVESIHAGVRRVVETVHERKPRAKVILQSLLPNNEPARNADVVQPINRRLEQMATSSPYSGYVAWLDLDPQFVDSKGQQIPAKFMDGVNSNEAGYRIWRDRLVPYLEELRDRRSR